VEKDNSIREIRFSYGEVELAKLSQIKRKYVITPYSYGQCIFGLLLHKYYWSGMLAIGYPIAIKEGIDFIYGAQVNTNLISYKFSRNTTILELFDQSREFFKSLKHDGVNYGYYPIMDIIQEGSKDLLKLRFIQANFKDKTFELQG